MRRLLLARGAQAFAVIALVATLAFVLVHLAPGDPFGSSIDDPASGAAVHAQQMHRWGYDQPLPAQYVKWIGNVIRGNFGWSHSRNLWVAQVLRDTVPRTILLMGSALVLGVLAGVALGTWQAVRRGTFRERVSGMAVLTTASVPEFVVGLAASAILGSAWHWFPATGFVDAAMDDSVGTLARAGDIARHVVLPAGTLALLTAASVSRYHRNAMLAVLPEEFIRTARAKGASELVVVRHALRNALGPLITIIGLLVPALFGGAVFVETIFNWPGMGRMMVEGVLSSDYPLVLAGVLIGSVFVVLGSALADVLAAAVNPRIRLGA